MLQWNKQHACATMELTLPVHYEISPKVFLNVGVIAGFYCDENNQTL